MGSLSTIIKRGAHVVSEKIKDTIRPYIVVYDGNNDVLVAGHHKKDIDQIAEMINLECYAGWMRVDKKQFEEINGEISRSGKYNLSTSLA